MESLANIYTGVGRWLDLEGPLALATVVRADGSTPQVAGASALFSKQGLVAGTLGGGPIEADAAEKAGVCLGEGKSVYYEFGLRGEGLSSEEAICGGSVSIFIDAFVLDHPEAFELMKKSFSSREAGILVSRAALAPKGEVSVSRRWLPEMSVREAAGKDEFSLISRALEEVWREGKPRLLKKENAEGGEILFFLEPLFPLPQLLIAGAGHIGQALARLGKRLDFEVTVIDDRADFANKKRFPEADAVVVADIGRALADFPVSSDTYIVIVTRGHSHDAGALRGCVGSPAAYIGMIGSRRKIALIREKFLAEGWATPAQFDRVHAPIGLQIGSKTIEEIAVSIAAELVLIRARAGVERKAGTE
jgi:xanthine dehydrogenase accessory factor